jgi:hypothetical protein
VTLRKSSFGQISTCPLSQCFCGRPSKTGFFVQNTAFGLKNGFLTANNLRPVPEQHRSVRRNKAGICREQANRGVLLAQTQAICG